MVSEGSDIGLNNVALRFAFVVASACFLLFVSPSFAFASSLVWGDENGGAPAQIEMTNGGTYSVPLNTSAPGYINYIGPAISNLYYIDNSAGSSQRQLVSSIFLQSTEGDVEFAWPSAGQYELDIIAIAPPCCLSRGDTLGDRLARLFLPNTAYAQTVPVPPPPTVAETLHFTIEEAVACTQNCFSNVLFLPGIESSRLYRPNGSGGDSKIWEPSVIGHDNTQLAMTGAGVSVNTDIYTKDTLESALGVDVYGSFLDSMQQLANTNGITFEAFPYDWRYAADVIASSPTHLATTTVLLVDKIKQLAATSKTGRVTVIAHSNGGLVAKELMLQLGVDAPKYIDKLIFVAVPQVGTPQAIAGMLHGYNEGIPISQLPLLITDSEARVLGSNMPGVFGLLPSARYFSSVTTPVVSFSTTTLPDWVSRYGETIQSRGSLTTFLTDNAGRTQPIDSDLNDPYVLSSGLLTQAQTMHQAIDTWTPPSGVELIQIAGWGVPATVSGISYGSKNGTITKDINTTIDGDGTVVVPSALWTSAAVGVKEYWIDLNDFNEKHFITNLGPILAIKHANILRMPDLARFISDTITEKIQPLSSYEDLLSAAPPSNQTRLQYTLHSPLTLDLYDNFGHHTGISTSTGQIEEQIPGTYYTQFGDVKYLFSDATSSLHILMQGYATSTFTFEADQLRGDVLVASTTWKDVPTTPKTNVSVNTSSDISTQPPLRVDENGDGTTDFNLPPPLNNSEIFPKVHLIVTANSTTTTLGSPLPPLTTTLTGFINGDSLPTSDVMGKPVCSTTATSAGPVGNSPISCNIGTFSSNTYDFPTFVSGILKILYRWDGFLQPINDTTSNTGQALSVFKAGSTVPVKFQFKKTDGAAVQAVVAPLWLTPQPLSPMSASVDESTYSTTGTSGNAYKWDSASQQYIYNWNTKGLAPAYWYRIYAQLDDGKTYSVVVGLR